MTSSHKRPREELNTTLPELSNAQKYRRVVPKQEMDMPTFSESSTTTAEGFGMHNNLNTQQGFSGPSNFRPTLPSPTPSFPIQTAPPQQQDHVKFETALEFLDQVKSQFSATPGVYKQFLKIMKDFKHHEIDTPGVIRRVSELFHGHDHLILGFNRFLPEGYKITPNDIRKNSAAMSNLSHEGNTNSQSASATAQPSSSSQISSPNRTAPMYERNGPIPTQENINVPETTAQSKVSPNASSESPSTPTQEKKQPELDHARNYVRKIKLRFERQPDIYKSFLRILHTFHEEHHTIKDVYDQVATLFRNHPDLLAEFKQFLPDKSGSLETTSPRSSSLRRRQSSSRRKSTTPVPEFSPKQTPSANDYNFFESAKSQLRNEPFLFNDFIKTLHLFNEGVLSRANLLILIRDLFSEYPELYEEFIQFCDFTDVDLSQEIQQTPSPSPPPVESRCEIDFTTCKKYGPSYRGIPEKYQKPKCSGRTSLCDEVLNDEWVSVPIGSEEFKVSLKSQYEEVLFACEDERHELDMVIELNDSTIKSLTAIAKQIAECSKEDLSNFKIQDGLDVLHLRSIERIYGNKGHLIIQGMSDNPVITIPIVLRRLQQKQEEWKSARSSWNTIWQEVHETNYYRSLDYQSEHFKNREKKLLNPRELLAEVKSNCFVPTSNVTPINTSPTNPTAQSHPTVLSFDMKESSIFADIEELIKFQATQMINMTAEPESLENFINNFIRNFFVTATCENTQGLLFGNNSFYVFFRFYQMLYERLLKAKQMAQDSFRKPAPNNTQKMMSHKLVSKPKKGFSNAEEKYSHYLNNMLRPLVEGDLDFAKYEDTCRELFGISSYILFTMDRLLKVLVKQIFSIFLEETSSKLAALMIQYQDVQESIYHTNALSITGEERCFKFIYKLPEGKFTIQVLDSELKPNTTVLESPKEKNSSKPVAEPPRNSVQPEQSETIDVQKHNVFLLS